MHDRFQEYQSAQDPTKTANSDSMVQTSNLAPIHWKPPWSSYWKINFNGAIFQDLQMAGIGMVIRNSSGQVIGALSDKINLPPIVDDVEAIACRKAISFALVLGVDEVRLKGNAVADKLAKLAKYSPCPRYWSDDIPCDVQNLVVADRHFC
nr:hypothetical protein CFP56_41771 [Quercus suber]